MKLQYSAMSVKSFKDIRQQTLFSEYGVKKRLNELDGKTVVVRQFVEMRGQEGENGPLYIVACELIDTKESVWFFTRAPWMLRYKDYVPFKAKIVKRPSRTGGHFFVFDEP